MTDFRSALPLYVEELLKRAIGDWPLLGDALALLRTPGLTLGEKPQNALTYAILDCFCMLSPSDWQRALPAAAAADLMVVAFEIYDKFLDKEGWGDAIPAPGPFELNLASYFHSLAHYAISDLQAQGFPPGKIAKAHSALTDAVLEDAAAQDQDVRVEGKWLDLDGALKLAVGKGAGAGGWIGSLGAFLATDDQGIVDACLEFGRHVGAYSQIVNDLNDSLPGATHKSDVRSRKSTLPLVYFLGVRDQGYAAARRILLGQDPISVEQDELIRAAMNDAGAFDFTATVAEVFRKKALNALSELPSWYDTSALVSTALG